MIVTYDLAVLLKEKGFNEPCLQKYSLGLNKDDYKQLQFHIDYSTQDYFIPIVYNFFAIEKRNSDHPAVPSAPTIDQVRLWLNKEYDIWLEVIKGFDDPYDKHDHNFFIPEINIKGEEHKCIGPWNESIQDAYEKGIIYILNNYV
jgi:hypothetical protein